MDAEGPVLETLTRRLAECPAEFLAEPEAVDVAAVVSDLLGDLGGTALTAKEATPFQRRGGKGNNWLRVVLVGAWLLHDDWFRQKKRYAGPARDFLSTGLNELAELVAAPHLVNDPDRREELVRLCLKGLGLRPAGESVPHAEDRLTTLSSVERQRVIHEARAAEERARKIREAMAKKAAEEAAARYMTE